MELEGEVGLRVWLDVRWDGRCGMLAGESRELGKGGRTAFVSESLLSSEVVGDRLG